MQRETLAVANTKLELFCQKKNSLAEGKLKTAENTLRHLLFEQPETVHCQYDITTECSL